MLDLDDAIEARAGRSIPEIFAESEVRFRELERELALEFSERDNVVVALGGGTVTDVGVRRHLLQRGTLITLSASLDELVKRVGGGEGRPLLEGDPRARLARLLEQRADAYAECHATLESDDALPERVQSIHVRADVVVPLGTRTYRVEIGEGIRDQMQKRVGASCIVVTDSNAQQWVPAADSVRVVLEPGERHKSIAAIERVWDAALAAGCDRQTTVVAVGGGVVGDLAGFAAATLMRGVSFGQVPTTLLAMVDSSVGGKTGFNRAAGKNLVGAFHQPEFVLCDVETLSSLPDRELRAAMAEVVKSAWLADEHAVAMLEQDADALLARDRAALQRAIRMSVQLKANIVAEDELEGGRRRVLNLGHTVGHAIEAAEGYGTLRHGEAVALGLVAMTRVSVAQGTLTDSAAQRMVQLLNRLELPTDLDAYNRPELESFLRSDKKKAGDRIHFVLAGPPGTATTTPLGPTEILQVAFPKG